MSLVFSLSSSQYKNDYAKFHEIVTLCFIIFQYLSSFKITLESTKNIYYIPTNKIIPEIKMIAKLKGIVEDIEDNSIIIDSCGVCYRVLASSKTISKTPAVGEKIAIFTVHIFTQDQQYLCGFLEKEEIFVFNNLRNVPGIGPKSALSILSSISLPDIAISIANQDTSILTRASGIGKKTAERIIVELKDKIKNIDIKESSAQNNNTSNDATLGLLSLGYHRRDIIRALKIVSETTKETLSASDLIIMAIRVIQS